MAYRVRTESFEGPFDLLLYLVNRQRVDIGSIKVAQIADQYLDEVARMKRLDLDVASDFVLVAATLLEIKAASLLPDDRDEVEEEFEDLDASQARDILLQRLIEYKKYKNAAAALESRYEMAGRCFPRTFGAPSEFRGLSPDYLDGVSLQELALHYVACYRRRDAFLLESEHIAGKKLSVEPFVDRLQERLRVRGSFRFSDVVAANAPTPVVVVTFLAVLELMKRNLATARQDSLFGDIVVTPVDGNGTATQEGGEDA